MFYYTEGGCSNYVYFMTTHMVDGVVSVCITTHRMYGEVNVCITTHRVGDSQCMHFYTQSVCISTHSVKKI